MELGRYLKSRINQKIIKFFLENPSSVDTSRGIATWINEDVNKTEKALKELVEAKILIPHGNDLTCAYGYTTDMHMIAKIKLRLKNFKIRQKKNH